MNSTARKKHILKKEASIEVKNDKVWNKTIE